MVWGEPLQSEKRDKACVGSGRESTWRIKPEVSLACSAYYFILGSLSHIPEGLCKIISLEEPQRRMARHLWFYWCRRDYCKI